MYDQSTALPVPPGSIPDPIDLASADHLRWVRDAAESLESASGVSDIRARIATPETAASPVASRLALKLALSRLLLEAVREPVHLSVVFAVYRENIRILTRDEHPHGEDFVRRKLDQLRWLFGPTPQHSWDLTIVDDGCPENSGRLARRVLDDYAASDETRVLFLEDAIREGLPVASRLTSVDDSRKGGAIRYGLWHATREARPGNHVALFTDADLSTHLAQGGLLVHPLTEKGTNASIGSRREPESVVVKESGRDARGRLFIYLWKRLLPQLGGIVDTQCGFKAFRASHLRTWIEGTSENGFAFDIEYLLRVRLSGPDSITRVPVAWIDSTAESTTTDLEPYLPMLRAIVGMYRGYLPESVEAERFAELIEALDRDSFRRLLERIPDEIASREPRQFDAFAQVSAAELANLAGA